MEPLTKSLNLKEGFCTLDEILNAQHLNAQHQEMLDVANELQSALHQGKSSEVLHDHLDHLIKFTQAHFAAEEQAMRTNCYPGFSQHKAEHDHLIKQILDLQGKINEGQKVFSMDVIYFIRHWIMNHLVAKDHAYDLYLKHMEKGLTS